MNRNFWTIGALGILTVVSLIFSTYKIGSIPNGFYADEVSVGVNANSIATTARDEYYTFLPVYFPAFGEYKNPIYIYTASVLVKIFGAHEGVVRFTGVLFALLSMLVVFLIGRDIFASPLVGFLGWIILLFLPWNFDISRVAFEVAGSTLFFLTSFYLLASWSREKPKKKLLYAAAVTLALLLYTYSATRLYSPLIFTGFTLFHLKYFWNHKKIFLIFLGIYLAIIIPFSYYLMYVPGFISRLESLNIFQQADGWKIFLQSYLSYFSPDFLLQHGELNPRHHSNPNMGQIFWSVYVLCSIAIAKIILKDSWRKKIILILALVIYPLAGAITGQTHALRGVIGISIVIILSQYALQYFTRKKTKFVKIFLAILAIVWSVECWQYYHYYFTVFPQQASYAEAAFNKEEQDLGQYLQQVGSKYDQIIITEQGRRSPPISDTFYQWYLSTDTRDKVIPYRAQSGFPEMGDDSKKTLIVLSSEDDQSIAKNMNLVYKIEDKGFTFFYIYESSLPKES